MGRDAFAAVQRRFFTKKRLAEWTWLYVSERNRLRAERRAKQADAPRELASINARSNQIIPPRLAESLKLALAITPQGDGQSVAQRELVQALQTALDVRRQRIILSESSINWVKWVVLLVQAVLTLLAVALIHSDNRTTNRIILTIFATGVGVAIVLIASHSRPFSGQLAVSPAVLMQVMPETDGRAADDSGDAR